MKAVKQLLTPDWTLISTTFFFISSSWFLLCVLSSDSIERITVQAASLWTKFCFYLWLHPVSPSDELSVTSTLFGHPVDESRAGSFSNPKRETPKHSSQSFMKHPAARRILQGHQLQHRVFLGLNPHRDRSSQRFRRKFSCESFKFQCLLFTHVSHGVTVTPLGSARFNTSTIHRLAARTLIRSLEQEQREDGKLAEELEKVVDLSVQSGVSSIFTAFIAVNKSNGEPVQGPLIYRENPTCIFRRIFSSIRKRTSARKAWKSNLFSASSFKKSQSESIENTGDCGPTKPARDPLLELVSLQDASGCWLLDPCLAAALGKSIEELAKSKVWGTILALIWLHGYQKDVKVEWELLAMKAALWLRAEKVRSSNSSRSDLNFPLSSLSSLESSVLRPLLFITYILPKGHSLPVIYTHSPSLSPFFCSSADAAPSTDCEMFSPASKGSAGDSRSETKQSSQFQTRTELSYNHKAATVI
ncbi:hypothetical protein CCH79_00003589 [Gambusia affinis]|uniref:Uncharacterized protein n=1 Tax=Gambusia affinis TaxID=33528 RepID=A0A315VAL4_GAMAF|nr:hypothetical protein CCH79_00003589 [Gambusia affinis]